MNDYKKSNNWFIDIEDFKKLRKFALDMFNFINEKDLLKDFNLWLFEDIDKNINNRNKSNGIQ